MSKNHVFERLVYHVGGIKPLAQALGCSVPAIYVWRWNGRIPARWARDIEKLTSGKFEAHEFASFKPRTRKRRAQAS